VVYGRPSIAAVKYGITEGGGGEPDEETIERCKDSLKVATAALDAVSRATRDLIINICVRESYPRWMRPTIPTQTDIREGRKFMAGIEALTNAAATGKARGKRRAA
jgi:hypothetical protein